MKGIGIKKKHLGMSLDVGPHREKSRILVVLVAGIGDTVLASKSLRYLTSDLPEAEIHLLANTEAIPIASHFPAVNRVWAFPIRELRKSKKHLLQVAKLIWRMRKMHYSMVLNLYRVDTRSGAFKMGLLFLLLGAKVRIGHDCNGLGVFLTRKLPAEIFRNRHVCDAMTDVAIEAGGVTDDRGIQISWDHESEIKWGYLFSNDSAGCRNIVALNPGGDRQNRRWSPENYAAVADRLISDFGAKVILLGGPGEEDIALGIENRMTNQPTNLAGQLGLSDLVYIISRVDLLVTNDSGPMHIGAATGTPLVAIFGPEDPSVHGPCTKPEHFRIVIKEVNCRPCRKSVCREITCIKRIHPDDVYERCKEFLGVRESSRKKSLSVDNITE